MQTRSFRVEVRFALIEPMTSSTNSSTSLGQLLASARFAKDQAPSSAVEPEHRRESARYNRRRKSQDEFLNREELDQLNLSLSCLSPSSARDFYRDALQRCALERKPGAIAIQQLVTVWKILRRWKWR
jgi:hypothetical protein